MKKKLLNILCCVIAGFFGGYFGNITSEYQLNKQAEAQKIYWSEPNEIEDLENEME